MQGATEGTCRQACVPGECEEFCGTETSCMSLQGGGSGACL